MLVQSCADADFDAVTHVCANPVWVEWAGGLPPLPVADSVAICGAIVGVWAIAWTVRTLARVVRNRG